ncbi:MAG: prolyl oligopeptidase family serine peptidase [Planctomycetota bacterium]
MQPIIDPTGRLPVFTSLLCAALLVLPAAVAGAPADEPREKAPPSPWSVNDVIFQESAGSWTLSRDGARALWMKRRPDRKKDRRVAQLMLLDVESGKSRPLTYGKEGLFAASFSPDGSKVVFLTGRQAPEGEAMPPKDQRGSQLWMLDLGGGEAKPLTAVSFGVSSYQWLDDDTLYLAARERLSHAERKRKDDKDDTIVVEELERFRDRGRSLFRYEIARRKLTRVAAGDGPLSRFALSPDGRHVVTSHAQHPSHGAEGKAPPHWYLRDLEEGSRRELFAGLRSKPSTVLWRQDSAGFYLVYPHSTVDGEDEGAVSFMKHVEAATGEVTEVALDWERGLSFAALEVTEDGFIAALADGVRARIARYTRAGAGHHREFLEGEDVERIHSLTKARDAGRLIYITGGASDPDHVMSARLEGTVLVDPREVHRPAGGFEGKPIARTEVIRWTGALDEEVEGILYYPHGYKPGERHPLVVMTHGGPHGADRDRFRESYGSSPNLYAQRGAFVLKTNYHGSSSYGLAFGESIKGRYYELEIEDIFAGIQKLIDEGMVDRERMGLVGWSNGAILTIAALTLAHLYAPEYDFRFKACAPGAGDVNWTSDYGNCAFGASFDDYYLGGPPWKLPELYLEKSPLFHVERVTTPTIIFFGTEDTNVPTEQGWEWYRALHAVGKAPVRFLLFPGEPHGLRKLSHQRRKLTEELLWFDRYLFETEEQDQRDSAIREGSPLDIARRRARFARVGGRYGVEHGGHLVPEVLPFGDFDVARFEVTVAQWQAFDPGFTRAVPAALRGSPNHPATGITGDDARAYLEWLSTQTGETWRLLREDEFRKLKAASGPSENTLDRWAGYAPSIADAPRLSEAVRALGIASALLEVGSRPPGRKRGPDGDDDLLFFDIGGNAAELVIDEEGKARARGGCALCTPDPRTEPPPVPADYVGLRVAREKATAPETAPVTRERL